MLDQLAWPKEFTAAVARLVEPLLKVTEPTVTELLGEVTVAVSVTELPTAIVEVEREREVEVAALIGGVEEDELLPHATIRTASIDDSPTSKNERGIRINISHDR